MVGGGEALGVGERLEILYKVRSGTPWSGGMYLSGSIVTAQRCFYTWSSVYRLRAALLRHLSWGSSWSGRNRSMALTTISLPVVEQPYVEPASQDFSPIEW